MFYLMSSFLKSNLVLVLCIQLLISCHKPTTSEQKPTLRVEKPVYASGFDWLVNSEGEKWLRVKADGQLFIYGRTATFPDSLGRLLPMTFPVNKLVLTSTTHVGFSDAISCFDQIVGMNGTDYVFNADFRKRVADSTIASVGNGQTLNFETLAGLDASAILLSTFGGDTQLLEKLLLLEVTPFYFPEWKENHPLGRSEWIKVLGELTGKATLANKHFKKTETAYLSIKEKVKETIVSSASVITGMGYQGVFYVPGQQSFMTTFLNDAGARYPWGTNESVGSITVSFELFYEKGLSADYWINVGSASSLRAIQQTDERFADFKAFKNQRIFNNNKRLNPKGWNDYFEGAVTAPNLVLSDLVNIFHPGVLNDSLFFYQKLNF